jgi:hypothetical protein
VALAFFHFGFFALCLALACWLGWLLPAASCFFLLRVASLAFGLVNWLLAVGCSSWLGLGLVGFAWWWLAPG